eukprot:SAG11_NODE_1846_length_4172_cov_3.188313_7_plen_151_part_00
MRAKRAGKSVRSPSPSCAACNHTPCTDLSGALRCCSCRVYDDFSWKQARNCNDTKHRRRRSDPRRLSDVAYSDLFFLRSPCRCVAKGRVQRFYACAPQQSCTHLSAPQMGPKNARCLCASPTIAMTWNGRRYVWMRPKLIPCAWPSGIGQ